MAELDIRDVTEENIEDLCWVCVPPEKRDGLNFIRGVEQKKKWAAEMSHKWGSFAKVAYQDGDPAGMIQYRPTPGERAVHIDCIHVPFEKCLRKGIATQLLSSLTEDVKKPMTWFDDSQPLSLVTKTFPGGGPGQYTAREFFTKKGFRQIDEDPDYLCYPLRRGFVYRPVEKEKADYIPQEEDKGKVLIICGPDGCPFTYLHLKKMERYIREIYPEVPIRWIDSSEEPGEVAKRRVGIGDCIVDARLIESFFLEQESFQEEVKAILKNE